jgi:hypothetical protein
MRRVAARVAALGLVLVLLGTGACQTHGLLGTVTPDYDYLAPGVAPTWEPAHRVPGVPFRLSRPEFLISPKKKEDGTLIGWEVLVRHVTDERNVYWVDIDPGFLHSSSQFKLTFGDAVTNKAFAPGSLVSVTHAVTDESGAVVDLIAEFATLGMSLYTLAAADTPAETATGGALTALAIANDPFRPRIAADPEEAAGLLQAVQDAGGDLMLLGFSEQEALPFASPEMKEAFQARALGAEAPATPMGGGGRPSRSHFAELKQALNMLLDERWQAFHEKHKGLFEQHDLTPQRFGDMAREAPRFRALAEALRQRLDFVSDQDPTWKQIEADAQKLYYLVLAVAVVTRLADTEEWRAKRIRTLYRQLKDEERNYLISGGASKPSAAYRNVESELYLALRMHSELEQRIALEQFLASSPYVATKGEGLIAEMKAARGGVNEILAAFQERVEGFIGDKTLIQPTAPAATSQGEKRMWLDEDVLRPRVLYYAEGRAQVCGDCPVGGAGEFLPAWAQEYLRACGEFDDLADGEMVIVLERGAPSRNFVPNPGNTLYSEVTQQ